MELPRLLIHLLTYSMEQSPSWEASRFSARQDITRVLWNPKVHYFIRKCPPPVPILSQSIPPHPTCWRPILILSSHLRLGLPSGLFPSGVPTKASPLPHTCYMLRPSHYSRFDHLGVTELLCFVKADSWFVATEGEGEGDGVRITA